MDFRALAAEAHAGVALPLAQPCFHRVHEPSLVGHTGHLHVHFTLSRPPNPDASRGSYRVWECLTWGREEVQGEALRRDMAAWRLVVSSVLFAGGLVLLHESGVTRTVGKVDWFSLRCALADGLHLVQIPRDQVEQKGKEAVRYPGYAPERASVLHVSCHDAGRFVFRGSQVVKLPANCARFNKRIFVFVSSGVLLCLQPALLLISHER